MVARAPINPAALTWARDVGHVAVEDLARALNVKPGRVTEFEVGEALPTFRQLTLMATKLDRPLGFFFAPPPREPDVPDTTDFRGRNHEEIPADLVKEIRRAEQHRMAMLDLGGRPERRIRLGAITWGNLAARAANLRHQFGLTDVFVPPESSNNQVFSFWRGLVEGHGILVFQTTKISLDAFRGLSVYHEDLPLVVVNGGDSPAGRTFTLFHELAHLINRTSGLCALRDTVTEETIANNFAASFLMPEPAVRAQISYSNDPLAVADHLARHFKVSVLAAAVRLRRLNVIADEDLDAVRASSDQQWQRVQKTQKNRPNFVPPWRLRYRDLGPNYIGTVARALKEGKVDVVDATYLFNARLPMVEQILNEYYRTGGVD